MDLQESTLYDLDLGAKVTKNVAQYHPHHVTYAPANFEVAMSNGMGEDAFTSKKHYLTLTPRSRSHEVLPSTLDIMRPMHRQSLKLLLPKV